MHYIEDDSQGLHHQWELEMQQQLEMNLISEHVGKEVKARVYHRSWLKDWVTVCYDENQMERFAHPFATVDLAEDYAEDWVLDQ